MKHDLSKSKITAFAFGLALCLALMLGIAFSVSPQTARAEATTIDALEVAFKKANVGDSLSSAFEFEDEAERTLKVPEGYTFIGR